jgi:hypothetical protein
VLYNKVSFCEERAREMKTSLEEQKR